MRKAKYTEKISVWVEPELKHKLQELAEAYGIDLSDLVRIALKRFVEAVNGEPRGADSS